MTKRGDEVKVGVMVMAVGAILIATLFLMIRYNPLHAATDQFKTYLKFAGGLEVDSVVRFAGMRRGKVVAVRLASRPGAPVEVIFNVEKGTPVRADSVARLAALSALGENYVEITPGPESSALLAPGQTIRSEPTAEFSELLTKFNGLSDDAKKLIGSLNQNINQISTAADALLANLNDATGTTNRKALASMLAGASDMVSNTNALISRSAPKIDAIAANLQSTSQKLDPMVERLHEASGRMNTVLEHLDGTLTESRPQVKKDLEALESTLAEARKLMADIAATLEANRNDVDTMVENFRRSSENLREFTDTIKQRPFSLVRVKAKPDRSVPK